MQMEVEDRLPAGDTLIETDVEAIRRMMRPDLGHRTLDGGPKPSLFRLGEFLET